MIPFFAIVRVHTSRRRKFGLWLPLFLLWLLLLPLALLMLPVFVIGCLIAQMNPHHHMAGAHRPAGHAY